MAFQLRHQSPTYHWPVVVAYANEDGQQAEETFSVIFHRLAQTRREEVTKGFITDKITERQLVDIVLTGWSGIKGPDDKEIAFSPKACDQLFEVQNVRRAIVEAWFESCSLKAKAKN